MRPADADRRLMGRMEIDDAYLGGKPVRGSPHKALFAAALQTTEDGKPDLACLATLPFTKAALENFVTTSIMLPLPKVSDGLG